MPTYLDIFLYGILWFHLRNHCTLFHEERWEASNRMYGVGFEFHSHSSLNMRPSYPRQTACHQLKSGLNYRDQYIVAYKVIWFNVLKVTFINCLINMYFSVGIHWCRAIKIYQEITNNIWELRLMDTCDLEILTHRFSNT